MTDQELKPCPWCGKKPKIIKIPFIEYNPWRIYCDNNQCTIKPYTGGFETVEQTIHEWNSCYQDIYDTNVKTGTVRNIKRGAMFYTIEYTCCGYKFYEPRLAGGYEDIVQNYCPNCGAKIVEEQNISPDSK